MIFWMVEGTPTMLWREWPWSSVARGSSGACTLWSRAGGEIQATQSVQLLCGQRGRQCGRTSHWGGGGRRGSVPARVWGPSEPFQWYVYWWIHAARLTWWSEDLVLHECVRTPTPRPVVSRLAVPVGYSYLVVLQRTKLFRFPIPGIGCGVWSSTRIQSIGGLGVGVGLVTTGVTSLPRIVHSNSYQCSHYEWRIAACEWEHKEWYSTICVAGNMCLDPQNSSWWMQGCQDELRKCSESTLPFWKKLFQTSACTSA